MGFISSGTTMFDNGALVASAGNMVLLNTATASSSASLSFNSTYINSDYLVYKFEFTDIHPATDGAELEFNFSTDGGSNYNVTKTSTYFFAYHNEAGSSSFLGYITSRDLAQSTAFQRITANTGADNDQCSSGSLSVFNPSSNTFVKHFISNLTHYSDDNYSVNNFAAGYGNTTSAVNAIQFKMSSGNIDAGQIKLYGIKGS